MRKPQGRSVHVVSNRHNKYNTMSTKNQDPASLRLKCTRRVVIILAAVPAAFLALGLLVPPRHPRDIIALTTVATWGIVYPGLIVAGFLSPLVVRVFFAESRLTQTRSSQAATRRFCRLLRTSFFSFAALVVVLDYWLLGIFAGLKGTKPGFVNIDVALAIVAIILVLLQIPVRDEAE